MKLKIDLLPKQLSFVNSRRPTNLYCGGVGAGKTVSEIVIALKYALEYSGITILFCSPNYRLLKDSVLQDAFNLIPKELIQDFKKGTYPEITFKKRFGKTSKILFRAFDEQIKAKALTVGLAILDELTGFKEEVYNEILNRLRQPNMPNLLFATSNPDSFEHYVYRNIVLPFEKKESDINYLHTTSFENYALPKNYINRLKKFETSNPAFYNSQVLGKWGSFSGGIIGAFPLVQEFKNPYRVAFIDPSFSDLDESDKTSVSVVSVNPNFEKEPSEWEIYFTGKTWQKSITDYETVKELLLFLDRYKPIETSLESQLSDSSKLFIDSFKRIENELGLKIKNSWTTTRQNSSKSKHERIMKNVASNKERIYCLNGTDENYIVPITQYHKLVKHDDEIDSLSSAINLWYNSKLLQSYIRYNSGLRA